MHFQLDGGVHGPRKVRSFFHVEGVRFVLMPSDAKIREPSSSLVRYLDLGSGTPAHLAGQITSE